jgi:hypothetical protein
VEEIMTDVFELTRGTECEPKPMLMPDVFLEYKGVKFGIGMDNKLWIRENDSWRKA